MSSLLLSHEQRVQGPWAKLQSEPKLFTTLMRELGVRGAQAREVLVLDDTDFDEFGEIYGFVFLFSMIGDGNNLYKVDEYTPVENPKNVYFANQVIANACATLAVLNIVLNNPQMEIGEDLREFKEFTKDFSPSTRGYSITNHSSFRLIHNSMARHPEEALVVEETKTSEESRGKTKGKSSGKSSWKSNVVADDSATAEIYHYVAYVPIDGEVWQLDGLYPHPISVGNYADRKKWHDAACEAMRTRIQEFYVDQINFVLLAITEDQLGIKKERVKECIYLKRTVETRLNELDSGWKFAVADVPDVDKNLSKGDEKEVCERDDIKKEIRELNSNRNDINKLIQLRTNWIDEIHALQKFIDQENKKKQVEKERQTFDYGPFIREYISILQERGELKNLLDEADDEEYEISF